MGQGPRHLHRSHRAPEMGRSSGSSNRFHRELFHAPLLLLALACWGTSLLARCTSEPSAGSATQHLHMNRQVMDPEPALLDSTGPWRSPHGPPAYLNGRFALIARAFLLHATTPSSPLYPHPLSPTFKTLAPALGIVPDVHLPCPHFEAHISYLSN